MGAVHVGALDLVRRVRQIILKIPEYLFAFIICL